MENILGHENIKKELYESIRNNNIGHAYIFEGREGIGKLTLAKEFAKIIMCENSTDKACNICDSCAKIESNVDFKVISPTEGIIKVEQIKSLNEDILLRPTISKRKVFIINDAELMNEQAQNKLLKTLEEPPKYAVIILITSNQEKLLKTIKSRCITLKFSPLSDENIRQILNGEEIKKDIIDYARGSVGKIYYLKQKDYIELAEEFIKAIESKDLLQLDRQISKIKENKNDLQDLLDYISFIYFKNMKEDYKRNIMIMDIIQECKKNIIRNANVDLSLYSMMVSLWKGDLVI